MIPSQVSVIYPIYDYLGIELINLFIHRYMLISESEDTPVPVIRHASTRSKTNFDSSSRPPISKSPLSATKSEKTVA
jgi:hypothetical protein